MFFTPDTKNFVELCVCTSYSVSLNPFTVIPPPTATRETTFALLLLMISNNMVVVKKKKKSYALVKKGKHLQSRLAPAKGRQRTRGPEVASSEVPHSPEKAHFHPEKSIFGDEIQVNVFSESATTIQKM